MSNRKEKERERDKERQIPIRKLNHSVDRIPLSAVEEFWYDATFIIFEIAELDRTLHAVALSRGQRGSISYQEVKYRGSLWRARAVD